MPKYRRSLVPGATYFFTVTLADRSSTMLIDDIDRLRRSYAAVSRKLPFETVAICVLPEHIHAVWTLPPDDADYSVRWGRIKAGFSRRQAPTTMVSASIIAKRERGIWQRRFWEHQIRDDEDLRRHVDYIHFNPVKHGLVPCAGDWRYSSFHQYVKRGWLPADWGMAVETSGKFGE